MGYPRNLSDYDDEQLLYELMENRGARPWVFIQGIANMIHEQNQKIGWWTDLETGQPINLHDNPYHISNKLMLIVSEIAEAMEGDRTGAMDKHLPEFTNLGVELADALIRIFDLASALDLPIGQIVSAKLLYNAARADHKPENRLKTGGKKY